MIGGLMQKKDTLTNIAYRCPECGTATLGLVGKFSLAAGMLRLKCDCGTALEIKATNDGKVKLSVPCIFCRDSHEFVISQSIFFERDVFTLLCPYSNMDICFLGNEDKVNDALSRTSEELTALLKNLDAEELSDIQPFDLDEEEILPDPTVYDTVNFIVRDLEDEGRIDCSCHRGKYELRFTKGGIQVYCPDCGGIYEFTGESSIVADDYLLSDGIKLK